MGWWSRLASASHAPSDFLFIMILGVVLFSTSVHSAALRKRRTSHSNLALALSDLHNDIYTGSNKEDGDGNFGNMQVDAMGPDPAPAPDVAPAPDPAPAPNPAPAPEPAQPDPVQPDPPHFGPGPDPSNTEDDDGHGNNGGPDIPSIDAPAQQQQQQEQQKQQEDQQQQQQQQEAQPQVGPTTPQPPPPPDTPEPLPLSEIKSNAADAVPDTGSSEEKGKSGGANGGTDPSGGGGGGGAVGGPVGGPDIAGMAHGAPDPFDAFGPPSKSGPAVPNYIDPFDPFFKAGGPPSAAAPPPPPPPPPNAPPPSAPVFGGSINMGLTPAAPPPPPPPPVPLDITPVIEAVAPPLPNSNPLPFNPFNGGNDPQPHLPPPSFQNGPRLPKQPPPPPPLSKNGPPGPEQPHQNEAGEKAPVEKMSAAEVKSLLLDKQSDLRDLQQERIDLARSRTRVAEPREQPPPPPQREEPPPPPGPSAAELKSLARDRAQDALDRTADMIAMAKEKAQVRGPVRG